jgi:tripartite-type tricarboxylate transporter receptor subunit TctC
MGKHIPGGPAFVVDYMTGVGGPSANDVYKAAKLDGLTIGNFPGGLFCSSSLICRESSSTRESSKYLGAPTKEHFVCAVNKSSGITSMEKWFAAAQPVKIGGDAPGSNLYNVPAILKDALGLPIQLVSGYKGTSQRLAADSGEVDGGCWSWESIKVTWKKGIESGAVNVLVQVAPKPHPSGRTCRSPFRMQKPTKRGI